MKNKEVLISDFDGYNVHKPGNPGSFREFESLEKAELFAKMVSKKGWDKAVKLLDTFKEILTNE